MKPVRVFHVSDLHFGRPVDSLLIEAIEDHIAQDKYDVIAVSGDLSQRSRAGEFQRASVFLRDAAKVSRVIVVPGNHDVAWWRSPMMIRGSKTMYEPYRRYVSGDLEPVLRSHAGRPHWGKRHSLGADELNALYPRFDDFRRLRAELDPKGRFLNDHLRALFGV